MALFEDYTYENLLEEVLDAAPDGIDTREGSIFYDAVSGILIQIAKMYTDLDLVFELVFISTASGEYLDLRASEYGLERIAASSAKYYLVYEGTTPDTGERFFHNDTGLYFNLEENDDGDLILVAEEAGTDANDILEGDLAVPVNTIDGLTSSTFGEVYEYGTDEESDDDLRTRIQEKIAGPAENGNKQHYKTWCESITGVGLARIYPLWNGPNTVKAVLISTDGKACTDSVVEAVQEYIDPATQGLTAEVDGVTYTVGDGLGEGVANLGAHFTAVSATEVGITVEMTAVLKSSASEDDAAEEIEELLEDYFKELVLSSDDYTDCIARLTAIGAIISGASTITDYTDLTINGDTENVDPGEDGVPVVAEVIINV